MRIDEVVEAPEFWEFHTKVVDAPIESAWNAFLNVRTSELRVTRALVRLRTLPSRASHPQSRDPDVRFIDAAPVPMIALEAPRYALAAGVGRPWTTDGSALPIPATEIHDFAEPGWAKLATDFRFIPVGQRTLITTETRVRTTDADSRRRFALYWFGIRAFSGIIRRDILTAVARRANAPSPWQKSSETA